MLNKQGPGKIDWTDYTWNPISGRCEHNCPYCYMHGFWARNPKSTINQIKENYLLDKMKVPPCKIFVGSSTDMWGDWVPDEWIRRVLNKASEHPEHTFMFLTKNPKRYADFSLYKMTNCWFGTSVDGLGKTRKNINDLIFYLPGNLKKFVSLEPLISFPLLIPEQIIKIDLLIIGADSSKGANKPPKEWADRIIDMANSSGVYVFVKDNYGYPKVIKEFPGNQVTFTK